jgi:hypothetical protein
MANFNTIAILGGKFKKGATQNGSEFKNYCGYPPC